MKKMIALGFMATLLSIAALAQDKMDNPNDKMSHDKMSDSKSTNKKKKSNKSTNKMDDTKKSSDKMDKM